MGSNQCSPSNHRKGKKETTQEKQTTTKATVQPKTTCSKKKKETKHKVQSSLLPIRSTRANAAKQHANFLLEHSSLQ
jgi:hypothetical protein